MEVNPTVIALVGTILGGSGLKIIEHWLSKRKRVADEATVIRTELRAEIDNLRKEVKEAQAEVDEWRDKYYALVNEVTILKAEAEAAKALARLKAAEAERLAAENATVSLERTPPRKRAPRKKKVEANEEGV